MVSTLTQFILLLFLFGGVQNVTCSSTREPSKSLKTIHPSPLPKNIPPLTEFFVVVPHWISSVLSTVAIFPEPLHLNFLSPDMYLILSLKDRVLNQNNEVNAMVVQRRFSWLLFKCQLQLIFALVSLALIAIMLFTYIKSR